MDGRYEHWGVRMLRKLGVVWAFVGALLLGAPFVAFAAESAGNAAAGSAYPAPPVTSSVSVQVLDTAKTLTSSSVDAAAVVPSAPSGGGLAYTGVPSDMIMMGAIAGVVVLLGIALVVFGARRAVRSRPHHS